MNGKIQDHLMKQERTSESIEPEKPAVSAGKRRKAMAASSPDDAPGEVTIDFHSTEFNKTDDLNDNSGNYRLFEPLDNIVTADMRHQMERRRPDRSIDAVDDMPASLRKIRSESDAAETVEAAPPLTVVSQGRTLIVDTDAERAITCGKLLGDQGLICTLLATKKAASDASIPRFSRHAIREVDAVSVSGAFGGFSAIVTVKGDQKSLTDRFGGDMLHFDLVLDLQPTPSFAGDLLPLGYYAPGQNPEALDDAIAELPQMRGRFNKPQFTTFLKSRCIHGRSRLHDCRRCLEVCPFSAIQSLDQEITINHYLCEGCGICALVCPTDSVRMAEPSQEALLSELQRQLRTRPAGADLAPTLVISDSESAANDRLPVRDERNHDHVVNFEVNQIGYVGLDMILSALAFGAGNVLVACAYRNPPAIRRHIEWQTLMARAILAGLGMRADKVQFAVIAPEDDDPIGTALYETGLHAPPDSAPLPEASFPPGYDKRSLVRLATQHLHDHADVKQGSIPLPAGSPFGAVTVDPVACTLCMACVSACPIGALSVSRDEPRLAFRESQCHQCGLCAEKCPEGAIQLLPRILCDLNAVEAREVLCEAEAFRCIECGVPFASQAMINRMQQKLMGHWMYAGERQLRRLQMCRTCRTRDALTSEDMQLWNR
jgi:Pyruvate/2-oxoacid:ferredoxin oxidoreductase delta subunit